MGTKDNKWEGVIADYWMDEDGILHCVSKQAKRTMENVRDNFELVQQITGGQKVPAILDNTHTSPYDMSTFVYVQEELCKAYKAIAFISRAAVDAVIDSVHNYMSVPVRFFRNEEEAKNWLKQFDNIAA